MRLQREERPSGGDGGCPLVGVGVYVWFGVCWCTGEGVCIRARGEGGVSVCCLHVPLVGRASLHATLGPLGCMLLVPNIYPVFHGQFIPGPAPL